MGLHRTLTARCDARISWPGSSKTYACDQDLKMNTQTTQPYRDLAELGWTVVTTDDDILTYCPKHPGGTA